MSGPLEVFEPQQWARRVRVRSLYHKAVLMELAERSDDHGECWPSQDLIAWDLGISERKVRSVLSELEDAGLIVRSRRNRSDGARTSDLIRLAIAPDWRERLPAHRAGRSEGPTGTGRQSLPAQDDNPYRHAGAGKETREEPREEPNNARADETTQRQDNALALDLVDPNPDDGFAEFWERYPARNGRRLHKARCERLWAKLTLADRTLILEHALPAWVKMIREANGVGNCDPHRWLTRERVQGSWFGQWEEWAPVADPEPRPSPQRYEDCHPEAQAAMDDYDRKWKTGRFADHA